MEGKQGGVEVFELGNAGEREVGVFVECSPVGVFYWWVEGVEGVCGVGVWSGFGVSAFCGCGVGCCAVCVYTHMYYTQ